MKLIAHKVVLFLYHCRDSNHSPLGYESYTLATVTSTSGQSVSHARAVNVISDPCIYSNDVENFINFIIPFKSAKCQNDCGLQVSSSVFENGPFVSFRKRNCFSSLSYFPRKKVLKMIKCYFLLLFFCFDLLNMEHKRNMGGKS